MLLTGLLGNAAPVCLGLPLLLPSADCSGGITLTQADLDAINALIVAQMPVIAAAVRAELAAELANMDAPISDVPAGVLAAAQVAPIQATSQARVLEGTITEADAQRIMLAAMAGKRQGLGTATEEYLAQDGTTPRITFTPLDDQGNGTTVVDGT